MSLATTIAGGGGGGGGAAAQTVIGPAANTATDNAIVRFDGITGALVQNSVVAIADTDALATPAIALATDLNTGVSWVAGADKVSLVAGGIEAIRANTVASGVNYLDITPAATGNPVLVRSPAVAGAGGISVVVQAPPATTGASAAGKPLALIASVAVASTDTNGAAAGGSVTITAGAAARLVSGNAAGGDITLTPGAGIGTGATGRVVVAAGSVVAPVGTASAPSYGFPDGNGIYDRNSGVTVVAGGVAMAEFSNRLQMNSTVALAWGNGTVSSVGTDTGLSWIAPTIVGVGNGDAASRAGWLQWAGQSFLAANATNATTTMAATGLTVNVTIGRKYSFRAILNINNDGVDGAKFDFDASTAAATNFRCYSSDTAGGGAFAAQFTTALSTDFTSVVGVADTQVILEGSFEPSSTGTFAIRMAEDNHVAGTLTLYRGSSLMVWDMP